MVGELMYAFRVMRLPLLDAGGAAIGKIDDIVVAPGRATEAPRVLGFVVSSQRRRIFVSTSRIASVDNEGVRLKSWDVDLNPFHPRPGERLIGKDVLNKRIGDEVVSDVALGQSTGKTAGWRVSKVRLAKRGLLNPRASYRLVEWDHIPSLFAPQTPIDAEAARLRDMHPSDVAAVVRALPLEQRRLLAAAMDDERLADVLEELPEDMDDEDAETMRQLLSHAEGTAGSLMTPDIIVMSPDSTVADALARIREPEILVSIAAQVFVAHAPHYPPTGTYLGVVHFQRLLRESPQMTLSQCVEMEPTIPPTMAERDVAERLASYNLLAVAVCDQNNRLLGAITVDDVLDRTLPANWRRHPSSAVVS